MILLQINTDANTGSTGRIAEDIGNLMISLGHKSYIARGRGTQHSNSELINIGGFRDLVGHLLYTRLFDRHCFASKRATRNFIQIVDQIKPDIIHLHNIHGYYINIEILFQYIKKNNIPVVWTLHDCWAFTGHCSYFEFAGCGKWTTGCYECPNKNEYPKSMVLDQSEKNYSDKKKIFNDLNQCEIITPSDWLKQYVRKSFLRKYNVQTINNGVNLSIFTLKDSNKLRRQYLLGDKKVILGVASIWDRRKGLSDFLKLRELLSDDFVIVLIGLTSAQIKILPHNIVGVERTESTEELALFYNLASVFVNPTYVDNFPTTNLESLACGTPVITYNTGGSPESIDTETGVVVKKGDVEGLFNAINTVVSLRKSHFSDSCRKRALEFYNKDDRYNDYLKIYEGLITKTKI